MTTIVYGSSDDLIEIEGPLNEEFYATDVEDNILAFSTGVVLRITYDDNGVWRITKLTGDVVIEQAPADDEDNYSDRATLQEDPTWVVLGKEWVHK